MPWGVPERAIDEAAAELHLLAVENAYYNERGQLVLSSGGRSYVIPKRPSNTLPRGSTAPASMLSEGQPAASPKLSEAELETAELSQGEPAVSPKLSEAEPETAKLSQGRHSPAPQPPTGGSAPPQASGHHTDAEPEPPHKPVIARSEGSAAAAATKQSPPVARDIAFDGMPAVSGRAGNCQSDPATAGGPGSLNDLTAIPGVGPVTAQKLHDAGLHTYSDIAHVPDLPAIVGRSTALKIRTWLEHHLT